MFGMLGAAVVTVLSDGVNAVLFYRLLGKHLQSDQEGVTLLLVGTATLLMGGIVWAANQITILPITVALGVLSYVLFALALRLVDQALLLRATSRLLRKRHAQ
jgi:peptidoglycan biosynthesis protein MviN/MurJ (putative lipid II flippase)